MNENSFENIHAAIKELRKSNESLTIVQFKKLCEESLRIKVTIIKDFEASYGKI